MAFRELLRQLLDERGLTMRAFATEAGTSVTTVSKVLQDQRTPPEGKGRQWADALHLRGDDRNLFLSQYNAAKAAGQRRAGPYVKEIERRLSEARALVQILVLTLQRQGYQIPQDLEERIRSL